MDIVIKISLLLTLPVLFGSAVCGIPSEKSETVKIQSTVSDTTILWNPNRLLKWSDFQGTPDSLSEYKAMTFSKIGYYGTLKSNYLIVDVKCYYEKKLSWSKDKTSTDLLKHEQLHFDIAEIIARKIRKEYSSLIYQNEGQIESDLEKIYDLFVDDVWIEENILYDSETSHGTIEKKQKEWEIKIANELKALEKYAGTRVVIKRVKEK